MPALPRKAGRRFAGLNSAGTATRRSAWSRCPCLACAAILSVPQNHANPEGAGSLATADRHRSSAGPDECTRMPCRPGRSGRQPRTRHRHTDPWSRAAARRGERGPGRKSRHRTLRVVLWQSSVVRRRAGTQVSAGRNADAGGGPSVGAPTPIRARHRAAIPASRSFGSPRRSPRDGNRAGSARAHRPSHCRRSYPGDRRCLR